MYNWKLLYNRQTEENWLLQCWWVFFLIATLCLKPWVAFATSVPVKSCVLLPLKRIFHVVAKRESSMTWDGTLYKRKASKLFDIWECEWWRLYKTTNTVKQHILEHFPYRRSLAGEQLSEEMKKGKLFGDVQCDIEVPENLRSKFNNFPPILKNTWVSKSDIGDLMKNYAEEERLLSQPRKMLISSFTLQNGTLITLLLLFYLQLSLVWKKTPICWVHSKEMVQQFCTVSRGRKKAKWRKSKLKCRRRNNEASS